MMSLLPENKPKDKNITPTKFMIWGQSMSGKTYLARQFPNPILLNTDGNAKKVDTPSVDIVDFAQFVNVLGELEKPDASHGYQTIVIDLIDDIQTMLEDFVCRKHKVDSLADASFGKAFGETKAKWKQMMHRLAVSKLNVVFISHIIDQHDDKTRTTKEVPSLPQKYYNMTSGRCDVNIKTSKHGSKTYLRKCVDKRDTYNESDVKDKKVLEILKTVTGCIGEDTAPVSNKAVPLKPTLPKPKTPNPKSLPNSKTEEVEAETPKTIPEVKKTKKLPVQTVLPVIGNGGTPINLTESAKKQVQ